mmetsp:Transcript_31940/g.90708  ORF Transcript_31940/g.90708 Transcript_31940/m.90708 type:complete len:202 (-) Transcript_31940:2218-2823(-)
MYRNYKPDACLNVANSLWSRGVKCPWMFPQHAASRSSSHMRARAWHHLCRHPPGHTPRNKVTWCHSRGLGRSGTVWGCVRSWLRVNRTCMVRWHPSRRNCGGTRTSWCRVPARPSTVGAWVAHYLARVVVGCHWVGRMHSLSIVRHARRAAGHGAYRGSTSFSPTRAWRPAVAASSMPSMVDSSCCGCPASGRTVTPGVRP